MDSETLIFKTKIYEELLINKTFHNLFPELEKFNDVKEFDKLLFYQEEGEDFWKYSILYSNILSSVDKNLTDIVIGNSVTSIGNNAFFNCINLTSVVIGN